MGPTVEAEGVEVKDAIDASEGQSLAVAVTGRIFALMIDSLSSSRDGFSHRRL